MPDFRLFGKLMRLDSAWLERLNQTGDVGYFVGILAAMKNTTVSKYFSIRGRYLTESNQN
jgi:hypothetical protein